MKHMPIEVSQKLDCNYCIHCISRNNMHYCTAEICEASEVGYDSFKLYPPKNIDGHYKRFSGADGDIGERQMEYGRRIRLLLQTTN